MPEFPKRKVNFEYSNLLWAYLIKMAFNLEPDHEFLEEKGLRTNEIKPELISQILKLWNFPRTYSYKEPAANRKELKQG